MGNPIVELVTGTEIKVAGTLLQSNAFNWGLFFGAGDFATDGATGFRADIPIAAQLKSFALVIDWKMQGFVFRFVQQKTSSSSDGDLTLVDNDAAKTPIEFVNLVPDTGSIRGSLLTNHPSFDPAA